MNFLILFILIIISTEIFIKNKYISLIGILFKSLKKTSNIINNRNISDHWKEKVIPKYSLKMIKVSFSMLITFLIILSLFLIVGIFSNEFLEFLMTFKGIVGSVLFSFIYVYFKKFFLNE